MDRLDAMKVLVAVAEAGGFSAAARRLRQPLPTISRKVALLEASLGAALLTRTTRAVALTDTGRAYVARAKRILDDVAEAESQAQAASAPAGELRVSLPIAFGHHFVAPVLGEFLAAHPRVTLDVAFDDRFVDLVADNVDIGVRVGVLRDSSLIARKLGAFRRVVCAAPAYLARAGAPASPADLARHDCLITTQLRDPDDWPFTIDGRDTRVRVKGCLRASTNEAVLQAAIAGVGLALLPSWHIRGAVAAGRLVALLRRHETPPVPIHAVYPAQRIQSAKTRALVDFLATRWQAEDFALPFSAARVDARATRR